MALKNLPDFSELFRIKIMRNVICCSKVHLFRYVTFETIKGSYNNSTVKLKS